MSIMSRAEKSKQTKNRIIDISRTILRKEGYQALTIARVCQASGISNGTFYHFFPSKQALVSAVFPLEGKLLSKSVEESIVSPQDIIKSYVSCYADFYEMIGSDTFYQIVFSSSGENIGNKTMYMEERPIFHFLNSHLERFQKENKIQKDADIPTLSRNLIICEIGVLYWACTTGQTREGFEKAAYSVLSAYLSSQIV